jgi:comEA protein
MRQIIYLFILMHILIISITQAAIAGQLQISDVTIHEPNLIAENSKQMPVININSADIETLQRLHGIGPKRAQAIIEFRNTHGKFKSIDDLLLVKGFGKHFVVKLLEKNPGIMTVQ